MNFQQIKRYEKIFSEPLYQIDFKKSETQSTFIISGSTKNVYEVNLKDKKFQCNCPDGKIWSKKHHVVCKHVCFVLFRVTKVFFKQLDMVYFGTKEKRSSTLFFDKHELTDQEMDYIDIFLNQKQFGNDVINEELKLKYQHRIMHPSSNLFTESTKIIEMDDECPICYDILLNEESGDAQSQKEKLLSCPDCRNYVHPKCMEKWLEYNQSCVYCRSEVWSKMKEKVNNNYVNLN